VSFPVDEPIRGGGLVFGIARPRRGQPHFVAGSGGEFQHALGRVAVEHRDGVVIRLPEIVGDNRRESKTDTPPAEKRRIASPQATPNNQPCKNGRFPASRISTRSWLEHASVDVTEAKWIAAAIPWLQGKIPT
jgi:hypothetical protein